ncbi:hypothetical protein SRABI128_05459 [Microbacterium sp. Bi128]|nr:hypothetical protein SRABI128_05459 [Microbacterium sp. Bi128]
MGRHHFPRLGGQLAERGKQLRIVQRHALLDGREAFEPAEQAFRGRAVRIAGGIQRLREAVQPAPGHRVPQRHLRGEVPVHAAVADAQGLRDVNHRGLGRPKAPQHVFRGVEDALFRQDDGGRGHRRSLSSMAIWPAS